MVYTCLMQPEVTKHYRGSRWISDHKRLAIYLRDDFRCQYCGEDMREYDPRNVGLDHLHCHVNGGNNHESNLIACCKSCNSRRGTKEWRDYATGGAVERIERQIKKSLNLQLAKALVGEWRGKWADR